MPPKRKPPPPRGGPRKQRAVAAGKNVVEQDVVNLTPVYLGIDHGTTATRVRVLVAGVEGSVPVSIVEAYSSAVEIGRQIGPGGFDNDVEFPGSFVWELGGNTNLNMNPFQARRAPNRMPLKWILIILAGDIDAALLEQLEQLPGGQTLFNIRDEVMNDPVKFAQLEQVWIDHFMRIKTEVDEYCELMECSVTQVILSIAHWGHTDGIQRVYDGLIRRVFTDLPESAFHYTGEANSVARCIIEEDMKLRRSELSKIAGDRRAFLFFDLGGSSLGGSLILLHRVENKTGNGDGPPARRNEPPAMLEIRDSGCFGGGEVWEWAIIENASKDRNRHWTYDQLTKYLQNFREQKGRLDNPLDRGIGISDGGETHEVSAGESRKCYGQAFQKIITLIQSEIEATIRELGGPDKFILIFTGGSCLGAHMIKFLRTYAESMKVDALFHGTGDVCKGNSDRTGMIARGNCYAMLRAISLGEFLNRGATFGIQTGDGVSKSVTSSSPSSTTPKMRQYPCGWSATHSSAPVPTTKNKWDTITATTSASCAGPRSLGHTCTRCSSSSTSSGRVRIRRSRRRLLSGVSSPPRRPRDGRIPRWTLRPRSFRFTTTSDRGAPSWTRTSWRRSGVMFNAEQAVVVALVVDAVIVPCWRHG
ncbi:hypothetical protein RB595_000204 [Gaeumannomyces hyphopodioides]